MTYASLDEAMFWRRAQKMLVLFGWTDVCAVMNINKAPKLSDLAQS